MTHSLNHFNWILIEMHKPFLILIGMSSVGFALIGIFVPLLPTVPFLLLALACFARSSEKLHQWVLSHKTFGPQIRLWHEQKSIPLKIKVYAIISIVASGSISIVNAEKIWVQLLIVCILIIPISIILKARNAEPQT